MYGIDVTDSKFKVGDRVRITDAAKETWWFKPGQVGVVSAGGGMSYQYKVDIDGGGYNNPAYVDEEHIQAETAEPKFKIGDVVRVIDNRGGGKVGDVGQVTDVEDEDGATIYGVLGIPGTCFLYESRLELAPDCAERNVEQDNAPVAPQPRFKAGDVVWRNGSQIDKEAEARARIVYAEDGSVIKHNTQLRPPHTTHHIVALVKNGRPLPSRYPHVHDSVEDATAEAERLARNNPGQEFAVYQRVTARVAEVHYSMKEVA